MLIVSLALSSRLLENWIDETEKRTWFLFECGRQA
jgi:starvation-inducible DNA-binding protein